MSDLLENPEAILNKRIAGLTVTRWLDADNISAWYEAKEDAGTQSNLYIYLTLQDRESNIPRIHGFRTCIDETIDIDGSTVKIFCAIGDYRICMPRPIKDYLICENTRPPDVAGYEIIEYLGSGFKGVTYKVRRKTGTRTAYALKLTIAEEYQDRSYLPEVDRMVDLAYNDRDHFPQVHDCGEWQAEIQGTGYKFIYFVEDCISGLTLDKHLIEHGSKLTATFLEKFIDEMLAALTVMEALDLMHDDLHAGNIIICSSLAGDRPCLIDFGSTKRRNNTRKVRDDIRM